MRAAGAIVLLAAVMAGCGDDGHSALPTPTVPAPTATASVAATPVPASPTPTASATRAASATPPPTDTATRTVTITPTTTATPTVTLTPTATATPVPPEILVFGVARADDLVQPADAVDGAGRPIYVRAQGQGMSLVVEARRGSNRLEEYAYDPTGVPPGVEIIVSRPLGDGSAAVCDYDPPLIGGVPGVDPLVFRDDPMVRDAIDDLGCRFNDGTGEPVGRRSNEACTRDAGALYAFVDAASELQFCLPIAKAWAFPIGDTIVAARVRDVAGQVSAVREIVVRVAGDLPFDCDSGLGERILSAQTPASRIEVGGQGVVSRDDWYAEPLRLCAGPDLGDGQHALTLRENATFGIPLIDGSILCTTIQSRSSAGVLDCSNRTPQDVYAQSDAESGRLSVDTGLGLPAGTGSASLRVPVSLQLLGVGADASDCAAVVPAITAGGALTTANGTAELVDADGAPLASLSLAGAPFSCEDWRAGGAPALVLPIPAANTPYGDLVAALVLAD